jgi:Intein splicing domain/LAGLIDADG-like domain
VTRRRAVVLLSGGRDYGVAGDTKVWIPQNARSHLVTIRDFCALPDGEYGTIAVDRNSLQLQWKRVTGRLTHRVGTKRCFRITLERGQVIDISEDHSLFTIGEYGHLLPLQGSQIRLGTPLAVPFDLSAFKASWAVDLATIDLRNVDRHASPDPTTSIVETEGSLTNRLRRTRFPLDLPLTDDLLRIIGLWIAEGGKDPASKSKGLAFSVGGLDGAPALLHRYFTAVDVAVRKSPSNDFDYRVESSVAYEVFRRLGLFGTAKAGSKRFPAWFWRLSQAQRRIVVAGFWDGDGCRAWKGEAPVYQKSHAIIRDLYHCLLLDGIFPTIKPAAHSQLRLAISRSADMTRFVTLYPLWHTEKRQSLIGARSVPGRDKTTGLWKFDRIWDLVAAATLEPGRKTRIYNSGGRYDNSVRAQRVAFANVPSLRPLVECKLAFLKVTAIEPVQHELMYDLAVEDAENSLANGFVAHNSGYSDCRPESI